jgi:outer membrane protein insertion porin family
MHHQSIRALALASVLGLFAPVLAFGQAPAAAAAGQAAAPAGQAAVPVTIATNACGTPHQMPAALPPAGSPPFVWTVEACFPTQGNLPNVESETYSYYIKLRSSVPSRGEFRTWDEAAREVATQDFKTLMFDTNFLDDMTIETTEHEFPNGVVGVMVAYKLEERQRVKIVDYQDNEGKSISIIKRSDIDEKLREKTIEIRLDSFLDEAQIRKVKTVVRELMAEKGFTNAVVSHKVTQVAGGPKLVNVTFIASQGPKIKIRKVEFVGNTAIGDGKLQRKMKENKPQGLLSFITSTGTYKEAAFEEDAAKVIDHYRNKGYARAAIGAPEVRILENTKDGKTQWIELRVPVTEGPRYRISGLDFDGNKMVPGPALRTLYKAKDGDWFNWKHLQDGNKKAQEIYGGAGYMEFNPFPMFKYSDQPDAVEAALIAQVPDALAAPPVTPQPGLEPPKTVVVTMRIDEGPQYFVNRLTFTGNTTTRDNVIRREIRLYEGNVFNTEALKYSVRRLNQLGYFRELHGDQRDVDVKKTPGKENNVDVTMKFEEQNRNQLTFGAGVSQYEGFFGQLAFQTSNFLGRGESLTMQVTAGDRSQNYQLAFTEPFLFDRNITGGFDVYKRAFQYIGYYTQKSTGANLSFGFPVADFSRMFINYAIETVRMTDLNEALIDQSCLLRATGCATISSLNDLSQLTEEQRQVLQRNPFVFDSLLLGQGGSRSISKVVPTFAHNTVDNPIFPNTGKKLTASIDLAMFGGNTHFYKPSIEAIAFFRHTARTSVGFRGQFQYIAPIKGTTSLPIFERLFLGGEYSVRGFDIRSIGPTVPDSIIVLGGNKSLLFNAEYLITIVNQVRIVVFADAGQVRDFGQPFGLKEDVTAIVYPDQPLLVDPLATSSLTDPNAPGTRTVVTGQANAFKASTGIELRFFMPVLNVPFRLIYSWNPSRAGVLDNRLQPAKETTFRFAVGTTF